MRWIDDHSGWMIEAHGWPWYILSARSPALALARQRGASPWQRPPGQLDGLVDPLSVLQPYDHRFRGPAPLEWVEGEGAGRAVL